MAGKNYILQFRIKPTESLLDVDPQYILPFIPENPVIQSYEFIDDRKSDAIFVTLLIQLKDVTRKTLSEIKEALVKVPKVKVYVLTSPRDMKLLDNVEIQALAEFVENKQG